MFATVRSLKLKEKNGQLVYGQSQKWLMHLTGSSAKIPQGEHPLLWPMPYVLSPERFLAAEEEVVTPYRFGVYDLLVLPPSFPYGGMASALISLTGPFSFLWCVGKRLSVLPNADSSCRRSHSCRRSCTRADTLLVWQWRNVSQPYYLHELNATFHNEVKQMLLIFGLMRAGQHILNVSCNRFSTHPHTVASHSSLAIKLWMTHWRSTPIGLNTSA